MRVLLRGAESARRGAVARHPDSMGGSDGGSGDGAHRSAARLFVQRAKQPVLFGSLVTRVRAALLHLPHIPATRRRDVTAPPCALPPPARPHTPSSCNDGGRHALVELKPLCLEQLEVYADGLAAEIADDHAVVALVGKREPRRYL